MHILPTCLQITSNSLSAIVLLNYRSVDSTNNYAIAKVRAGLAFHGNVFFAHEQFAGKGQFGRKWNAAPGQNILMSIVLEPFLTSAQQFSLSACIADACVDFLND